MNTPTTHLLYCALLTGAAGQFVVSMLNLRIPKLLHWDDEIARLPLLMREVFQVHVWFITITLLVFSTVTARFAGQLAAGSSEVGRWLCAGIGAFWLIRTFIQFTYYSSSHWRGLPSRFAIHLILLAAYGALAVTYLTAAFI